MKTYLKFECYTLYYRLDKNIDSKDVRLLSRRFKNIVSDAFFKYETVLKNGYTIMWGKNDQEFKNNYQFNISQSRLTQIVIKLSCRIIIDYHVSFKKYIKYFIKSKLLSKKSVDFNFDIYKYEELINNDIWEKIETIPSMHEFKKLKFEFSNTTYLGIEFKKKRGKKYKNKM